MADIELGNIRATDLGPVVSALGDRGRFYWWTDGKVNGNFDLFTCHQDMAMWSDRGAVRKIWRVSIPRKHPGPPATLLAYLKTTVNGG